MPKNLALVAVPTVKPLALLPASEADFNEWLLELLPSVRTAFIRQGLAKIRYLTAFQYYLQQRNNNHQSDQAA